MPEVMKRVQAVCEERLESSDKQAHALAILDTRDLYPECSLADLYDELTMPPELRTAHQQNDKAVMQAYGFPNKGFAESDCVAVSVFCSNNGFIIENIIGTDRTYSWHSLIDLELHLKMESRYLARKNEKTIDSLKLMKHIWKNLLR